LWGKGTFSSFSGLSHQGVETAAVVPVFVREVWVIDGAVVPIIGMPLGRMQSMLWQLTWGVGQR
jgi:hypothetical protein